MERPNIKIPLQTTDWILEIIAVLGLVALIAYPLLQYGMLPETMPTHFNFAGEADAFGGKATIFTLPIIGVLLYFFFGFMGRFTHRFNYPVKITAENAAVQYSTSLKVMRILKAIILCFFAYLTFGTIQVGLEFASGLNPIVLIVFVSLLLISVVYSIVQGFKHR